MSNMNDAKFKANDASVQINANLWIFEYTNHEVTNNQVTNNQVTNNRQPCCFACITEGISGMMARMKMERNGKVQSGLSRGLGVLILLAAVFEATLKPSYAYIDPGTGSFMIQMAIAGVLGALFTLKTFWAQVKAYVSIHILHRTSSSDLKPEGASKPAVKPKKKST